MPGPLGSSTHSPVIDSGTNALTRMSAPAALGTQSAAASLQKLSAQVRKLAAIAYGEASAANDSDEIAGIAFAVADRARAWGNKTVDQLLAADPNYTYAATDGNVRYGKLMKALEGDIERNVGMKLAVAPRPARWPTQALIHPKALIGGTVLISRRTTRTTRK